METCKMKVVLLAGGLGSRLSEETTLKPKPMVEIGHKPIMWHIMKIFAAHGFTDFIICLGYKGFSIKEYFFNYNLHMSDVTIDTRTNDITLHRTAAESWKVTLIDTGDDTMTGGRLRRIRSYLGTSDFFMTYGDGVGNIDVNALLSFHQQHGQLATVTAVRPLGRFGAMVLEGDTVMRFEEKPDDGGGVINGGFFVLSPKVLDYIDGDATMWERGPLERLAKEGNLRAFHHHGFWQPMDTLRDKIQLDQLWTTGKAPWKIW